MQDHILIGRDEDITSYPLQDLRVWRMQGFDHDLIFRRFSDDTLFIERIFSS